MKKIDKENFEKLCGIQCSLSEISSFFNCSEDTIQNWCKKTYNKNFSAIYKEKRCIGNISLRRNQFRLSENSATMAIFLGKQYLGQSDKVQVLNPNPQFDALMALIQKQNSNESNQIQSETEPNDSEDNNQ